MSHRCDPVDREAVHLEDRTMKITEMEKSDTMGQSSVYNARFLEDERSRKKIF